MPLDTKEKQHLKGRAHALKPVIMVGSNGVTEAVMKEVERALNDHELIKIRVQTTDRDERRAMLEAIRDQANAELIQTIGAIGVYYRKLIKK